MKRTLIFALFTLVLLSALLLNVACQSNGSGYSIADVAGAIAAGSYPTATP